MTKLSRCASSLSSVSRLVFSRKKLHADYCWHRMLSSKMAARTSGDQWMKKGKKRVGKEVVFDYKAVLASRGRVGRTTCRGKKASVRIWWSAPKSISSDATSNCPNGKGDPGYPTAFRQTAAHHTRSTQGEHVTRRGVTLSSRSWCQLPAQHYDNRLRRSCRSIISPKFSLPTFIQMSCKPRWFCL